MALSQGSDAAACSIPENSTEGMSTQVMKPSTPVMKPKREPFDSGALDNFSMFDSLEMKSSTRQVSEDDISTVAPSPWYRSELESPWGTPWGTPLPMPGKQRGHAQPGTLILPDIQPTLDFHTLSGNFEFPRLPALITPATKEVDAKLQVTPCVTPRSNKESPKSPPPRPVAQTCDLMKALRSNSVELLRSAIVDDPFAAQFPVTEMDEPALCAAVRMGCSPEIIELLLAHRADVNAADSNGQTPLRILKTRLKLHKFEVDVLGSKDELPESVHLVEGLLKQAQAQTGVLQDDAAEHQDSDMDINSSAWGNLLRAPPPSVCNMDLFEHLVNTTAFATEPVTVF